MTLPSMIDRPFAPPPARSKYGAVRTAVDGITFHSAAEARRYGQLKLLERAGHIRQIELQPVYVIEIGGMRVCKVILDFRYWEGQTRVIEDVKGKDTAISRLKRKLVEAQFGVKITLVRA